MMIAVDTDSDVSPKAGGFSPTAGLEGLAHYDTSRGPGDKEDSTVCWCVAMEAPTISFGDILAIVTDPYIRGNLGCLWLVDLN